MLGRHISTEEDLLESLKQSMLDRPPKFSPTLLALRAQELGMVRGKQYEDARRARLEVNEVAAAEREALATAATEEIRHKLGRLTQAHLRERRVFADKASRRWDKMLDVRSSELNRLRVQFRSAESGLLHARTLQARQIKAPSAMGAAAAAAASQRGEAAAAAAGAFILGAPGGGAAPQKRRPQTSGGSLPAPGRVGSRGGAAAATSAGKRRPRTTSGGARRRRPKSRGRARSARRKAPAAPCGWCAVDCSRSRCSIPREGSDETVGEFCGWECAKAWNNKHSPTQLRWIRSLFIDDLAGRGVKPAGAKLERMQKRDMWTS